PGAVTQSGPGAWPVGVAAVGPAAAGGPQLPPPALGLLLRGQGRRLAVLPAGVVLALDAVGVAELPHPLARQSPQGVGPAAGDGAPAEVQRRLAQGHGFSLLLPRVRRAFAMWHIDTESVRGPGTLPRTSPQRRTAAAIPCALLTTTCPFKKPSACSS